MSNISHWAAVGIPSRDELVDAVEKALDASPETSTSSFGDSFVFSDGTAEIWVHQDAGCAMPYFYTETTITVKATGWVGAADSCPFCATLDVEVLDDDGWLRYPLALAFNNAGNAQDTIALGVTSQLALATFIESGESWKDLAAYKAAHPDKYPEGEDQPSLRNRALPGLNWFIPLGRFAALDSMRDENPRACFYGTVISVEQLTNAWVNKPYRKVKIACADTVYDCVIQDDLLPDLSAGNIVYVECWLSASLISEGS